MKKSFFRLILASLVALLFVEQSKATIIKPSNLRELTIELIVKSGNYDIENASAFVETLNDNEVSELFSTLNQENINHSESVNALVGQG